MMCTHQPIAFDTNVCCTRSRWILSAMAGVSTVLKRMTEPMSHCHGACNFANHLEFAGMCIWQKATTDETTETM